MTLLWRAFRRATGIGNGGRALNSVRRGRRGWLQDSGASLVTTTFWDARARYAALASLSTSPHHHTCSSLTLARACVTSLRVRALY